MPKAGSVEETLSLRSSFCPGVQRSEERHWRSHPQRLSQSIFESHAGAEYTIVKDCRWLRSLEDPTHETVSLVGAFGPYIRGSNDGNPLFIIEKNPQTLRPDEMKFFRPESEMASALKLSDAVISPARPLLIIRLMLSSLPSPRGHALLLSDQRSA